MSEKQSSKSITIKTKILSWVERNIITITITSACITIIFLFVGYAINGRLSGGDFDHDYLGALGDFLGGFLGSIFGIITIYLVYKTYVSQKEELEEQRKLLDAQQNELKLTRATQEKQNFENTFFKLYEDLNTARKVHFIPKVILCIADLKELIDGIDLKSKSYEDYLISHEEKLKKWGEKNQQYFYLFFKKLFITIMYIRNSNLSTKEKKVYYDIIESNFSISIKILLPCIHYYVKFHLSDYYKNLNYSLFEYALSNFNFYSKVLDFKASEILEIKDSKNHFLI